MKYLIIYPVILIFFVWANHRLWKNIGKDECELKEKRKQ